MTDKKYFWLHGLLYLFFIVQFVLLIKPDFLSFGGDAMRYVHDIGSPIPESWHSPFFIYELKFLNFLAQLIISSISLLSSATLPSSVSAAIIQQCNHWMEDTGLQAIRFLWGSTLIMFFCTLLFFFRRLIQKDKAYMLTFALFALSLSFILHFQYFFFLKYIDAYFCHFAITAALALFFAKEATGKKRLFLYICFFILLIHCILYRKNAFFIAPVYLYYFIRQIIPHRNGLQPFLYTAAATLSLLALCFCINISLPSRKQYPLCVMLVSDMQIITHLSGDKTPIERVEKETRTYSEKTQPIGPQYGIGRYYFQYTPKEWNTICSIYMDTVLRHPREWMVSHVIQTAQFLCDGYIPVPIRKAAQELCPATPTHKSAWNWKPVSYHSSYGRYEKIWLYLAGAGCLLYGLMRRKRHSPPSPVLQMANFFAFAGMAYCLSFLVAIPTPDTRYHSFSVLCACLCISLYAGYILKHEILLRLNKAST